MPCSCVQQHPCVGVCEEHWGMVHLLLSKYQVASPQGWVRAGRYAITTWHLQHLRCMRPFQWLVQAQRNRSVASPALGLSALSHARARKRALHPRQTYCRC